MYRRIRSEKVSLYQMLCVLDATERSHPLNLRRHNHSISRNWASWWRLSLRSQYAWPNFQKIITKPEYWLTTDISRVFYWQNPNCILLLRVGDFGVRFEGSYDNSTLHIHGPDQLAQTYYLKLCRHNFHTGTSILSNFMRDMKIFAVVLTTRQTEIDSEFQR